MPYTEILDLSNEAQLARLKPIGNWILVRKCGNGQDMGDGMRGEGGILFPTATAQHSHFVELIDVGPECQMFTQDMCARHRPEGAYGESVRCVESSHHLHCVDHDMFEYWMVRESETLVDPKTKRKEKRWLLDPCIYQY